MRKAAFLMEVFFIFKKKLVFINESKCQVIPNIQILDLFQCIL